ncbi:MAG: nucleotidyltransferase family protein [Myxococcota bacterium]
MQTLDTVDFPVIPAHVQGALRALKDRLAARFGQKFLEMRLFGSFARGEQHEESDVDVLLLFEEKPDLKEQDALFREVAEVDVAYRLWISPRVLSREKFQSMLADELQLALDIENERILV